MVLAELGLRLFFPNLGPQPDERSLSYRYDETLGWFPIPNSTKQFTASRTITVTNNSKGFRGPESEKSGKPKVMFLGDSFVWGYDVEASERFTEKLQARHPEWTVFNCGVSGYGTDQEYLLLQRWFDDYRPSVVFLIFCSDNDHDDNAANASRLGYFKPYYTLDRDQVRLNGTPVPRGERTFCADQKGLCWSYLARLCVSAYFKQVGPPVVHNPDPSAELILVMWRFASERGAHFAVGIEGSGPRGQGCLKRFLEDFKIPFVDLTIVGDYPLLGDYPLKYPSFGGHWTPQGHDFVCDSIDGMLGNLLSGQLNSSPAPSRGADTIEALARFHFELADRWYSLSGEKAIDHYRIALRLKPDFPEALNNLAWVLATHPNARFRYGPEAVRLAERACELTGQQQAVMLGTLAAAYAEAGRFGEAVSTAEKASTVASSAGDVLLAERNRQLAVQYRAGRSYREQ